MWSSLPESSLNTIIGGYRNPAPNEPVPESLARALRTSAFVTAEIVQFEGAGERKLKLDCIDPPTYLVSNASPEGRWVIQRRVLQMSGQWHPAPPRTIMVFTEDFYASGNADTFQVSISRFYGSAYLDFTYIRTVRVIKKCSRWNKIRNISPKVGKLAIAFKELWAKSQERHYAPGGQGYKEAAERFSKRQRRS